MYVKGNAQPIYDPLCTSPMEQIAKIHGEIEAFINNHPYNDVEEFMKTIACIVQDYIKSLDLKLNEYREEIQRLKDIVISYVEDNEEVVIGG